MHLLQPLARITALAHSQRGSSSTPPQLPLHSSLRNGLVGAGAIAFIFQTWPTLAGPMAEPYPGQFQLPEPPRSAQLSPPASAFAGSEADIAATDVATTEVVAALDVLTPEQWQRRILWRPVELSNTGFQVMMPNQPRYVSEGRSDQPMQTQHFLSASDPGNDALYMVGWRDAASWADAETQARRFETERNAILNGFAGELLHETNVQLQGNPGKHYRILGRLDGEPWIITHRAYALGDRLVQMSVAVPQEREPDLTGMAEGFLQSLQPL